AAATFVGLLAAGALVALLDAPRLFALARGGKISIARASSYAAYGAPLAAALLTGQTVQALTRILLHDHSGAIETGAFAAAYGLARPLDLLFAGLSAAFAPMLIKAYETEGVERAQEVGARGFALLAALTIPACVGLALVAGPLSAVMVGEALRDHVAATLPWMAGAALFVGFAFYYWAECFQLSKKTSEHAMIMLAPAGAQLALTAWLAPQYGALGAAYAACAAGIIAFCLLGIIGRRRVALPVPWRELWRILAATGIMTLAVLSVPTEPSIAILLANVIVGVVTYAVFILVFDVLQARKAAAQMIGKLSARRR
ncbi:MAG TPA: polysaccharide biosynthesis C-terminal domain-containing protein, partial [Verrucomicrobiae bacterium]|nr:polysaccharide biosynthesis C-terminal domain-containing protein [Verrucomicrobiae bacterium]